MSNRLPVTITTRDTDPFVATDGVQEQSVAEWSPADFMKILPGERQHGEPRSVVELGKHAVARLVRLPAEKIKAAYHSEYGQKLVGAARGAVTETALTALSTGATAIGERLGIQQENGQLTIRKAKLARAALKIAKAPYLELGLMAKDAGRQAYAAGRQEARSQANVARAMVAHDALGYMRNR